MVTVSTADVDSTGETEVPEAAGDEPTGETSVLEAATGRVEVAVAVLMTVEMVDVVSRLVVPAEV